MFCMHCGQELPEGARFCMKCGTPQGAVSPSGTTSTINVSPKEMVSPTETTASLNVPPQEVVTPSPFKPLKTVDSDVESYDGIENINPFVPLGSANSVVASPQAVNNPSPFVPSNPTSVAANNVSFVPAMCPNCNAHMQVNPSYRMAICPSCGTECLVQEAVDRLIISGSVNLVHSGGVTHTGTVTLKKDYSTEPNLYVSYASADPTLGMTMKIPKLNITNIFNSGMNQSFHVAPGQYLMRIKFGTLTRVNVNAERVIVIKNDGSPTRVNIGWQGGIFTKYYFNVTS